MSEKFRDVDIDYLVNLWNKKSTIGGKPEKINLNDFKKPGRPLPQSRILQNDPNQSLINTQAKRPLVVIESPYLSEDIINLAIHIKYAKMCLHDSLMKGEAPILSSLLYKQVLNFNDPIEHDIALMSNLSWIKVANLVAVYIDYGISPGMKAAINTAKLHAIRVEYRMIGKVGG